MEPCTGPDSSHMNYLVISLGEKFYFIGASEILNFSFLLRWDENNFSGTSTEVELVEWTLLLVALSQHSRGCLWALHFHEGRCPESVLCWGAEDTFSAQSTQTTQGCGRLLCSRVLWAALQHQCDSGEAMHAHCAGYLFPNFRLCYKKIRSTPIINAFITTSSVITAVPEPLFGTH